MKVYRITLTKWAKSLTGSGYSGRWNSNGFFILYTSSSRALAALENVVHRSGEGLNNLFKTMVIEIPDNIRIDNINIKNLPKNWSSFEHYSACQELGDKWIKSCSSLILKVPSAIIKNEFNYLINPQHNKFSEIKIISTESFEFDERLKK